MIIIGYQGIGKTTLSSTNKDFIDLESSTFFVDGNRRRDWYLEYCNVAESLSRQGYNVFVSSHKEVRDRLRRSDESVIAVVPSLDLKDFWIEKLRIRSEEDPSIKNKKAYLNARDRYEENIKEIKLDCHVTVEIYNKDYNLLNLINKAVILSEIKGLLNGSSFDEESLNLIKDELISKKYKYQEDKEVFEDVDDIF